MMAREQEQLMSLARELQIESGTRRRLPPRLSRHNGPEILPPHAHIRLRLEDRQRHRNRPEAVLPPLRSKARGVLAADLKTACSVTTST
ncbi:hypothetical protein HK405_013949 [Cladochytrium tenue]|nr:hypothetical protein HK405_013949 [Cladochytrium tenue]